MIPSAQSPSLLTRLALAISWNDDAKIAKRLAGFSATEAGSALDMLKAAEECTEPKLRRLFFRHALDEARHADMFHAAAIALQPDTQTDGYDLIHATRQNLWAQYGLIRFLAFVYVAEAKAAQQFAVLVRKFEARPEIAQLFRDVLKDERFHVAYSRHLLDELIAEGHGKAVRRALWRVRVSGAWGAWRRAGRRIGDFVSRGILTLLYATVVPVFALFQRVSERRPATGWQAAPEPPRTLEDARGQS